MKIGDRVRLLRGTEEGKVVNIRGDKIVEIEIEDGFVIPALKNEVVIIDKKEEGAFEINSPDTKSNAAQECEVDGLDEGIYLGLVEKGVEAFSSYLINHTGNPVLFVISQYEKKSTYGKSYGICESHAIAETGDLTSGIFNTSKGLVIQLLVYEHKTKLKKQPFTVEMHLRTDQLKNKKYLGSLSKEVSLVKISEIGLPQLDLLELQTKMMEGNAPGNTPHHKEGKNEALIVDLHFSPSTHSLKKEEILEFQLQQFENACDNALLQNATQLKVIHGIGSGVLRNEIHKRISHRKEVKFFEDADKEKFGFGATIIYF